MWTPPPFDPALALGPALPAWPVALLGALAVAGLAAVVILLARGGSARRPATAKPREDVPMTLEWAA